MLIYCEKCNDGVVPVCRDYESEFEVRGKKYRYTGARGYCPNCGELIDESPDIDLRRRDIAYRKTENIITIDQINEILGKYNIGKKPLAKLLGWGENTIVRYVDGYMPSKTYSDILLNLLNDVSYMSSLVNENYININQLTVKKVRTSIKKLNEINKSEIDIVANYIINKIEEVTPLALQKILYYAQGFYMAFFDTPLFENDCQAWVLGPVYTNIYYKYKDNKRNPIVEDNNYEFDKYLDKSKTEFLNRIIEYFGLYSGTALVRMTHSEQPWLIARKGYNEEDKVDVIIDKEIIKDYFVNVKKSKNMININDIKKYSSELFDKIQCG